MMDLTKSLKIGIDKIELYNFEVINKNKANIKTDSTEEYYEEKLYASEKEVFSLNSSIKLYENGAIKEYSYLVLNPAKVLHGHNIFNADHKDLNDALEIVKEKLLKRELEINLDNAKIKSIEININFALQYKDYFQVFLLLFSSLKDEAKFYGTLTKDKVYDKKFSYETLFYNWKNKSCIVYNKSEQVKDKFLIDPLIRLEWKFERPIIYEYLKRTGLLGLELAAITTDDKLINEMFMYYMNKDFFSKTDNFITENIKGTLEREFIAFKNANKTAKKYKRTLKRDVYKHLTQFWIFDESLIFEILKKHNQNRNSSREIQRFKKNHPGYNNLKKLQIIQDIILRHYSEIVTQD